MVLVVYEGYLPPIPGYAENYGNLSLQYEGRAANIGFVRRRCGHALSLMSL